jgi:hypothetical protein
MSYYKALVLSFQYTRALFESFSQALSEGHPPDYINAKLLEVVQEFRLKRTQLGLLSELEDKAIREGFVFGGWSKLPKLVYIVYKTSIDPAYRRK